MRFAVWAPNARIVTVVGDFNDWDVRRHPMRLRNGGVWEFFMPGLRRGRDLQVLRPLADSAGYQQLKADPYAFCCEMPPKSASVVWSLDKYQWDDAEWMEARAQKEWLKSRSRSTKCTWDPGCAGRGNR